jgi:hypothetical protein
MIRLLRNHEGAALLEFALAFPILMFTILGVIEFGRVLWTQNALHYAVEQAARCRTIGSCTTDSLAQTYAAAETTSGISFPLSAFAVHSGVACGTGVGNQVIATYTFQFLTSLIGFGNVVSTGGSSGLSQSLTLTAQACFPTG